jgi:ribonuclease T2
MKRLLTISIMLAVAVVRPAFPQQVGKAGQFDYYLLVLSWSPEFCFSKPSSSECKDHRGFVLHGLWPQFNNGRYPVNCPTTQPGPTNLAQIEQIMPKEIVKHEWQKHGTCSGLSGDEYFQLAAKAFHSVKIPKEFVQPTKSVTLRAADVKNDFDGANAGLAEADIAIELHGGYLSAVEICVSKAEQPKPTACLNIKGVNGGTFKVPPVR